MPIIDPIITEVFIRDNTTEIIRQYIPEICMLGDNRLFHAMNWNKGIYSCDCYRGMFFNQNGQPEYKGGKEPCGRRRYSVELRNQETGQIYYTEFI